MIAYVFWKALHQDFLLLLFLSTLVAAAGSQGCPYQDSDGPSPGPRGTSGTHPRWQPLHLRSQYLGLACGHSMTGSRLGPEVGICVHQPGAVSQFEDVWVRQAKPSAPRRPGQQ